MRIYEFAKQHNMQSQDVKQVLDQLGIIYKTHSSAIPKERMSEVESALKGKKVSPVKKAKSKAKGVTPKAAASKKKKPAKEKSSSKVKEEPEEISPDEVSEEDSKQERLHDFVSEDLETQIEKLEDTYSEGPSTWRKSPKHHSSKTEKENEAEVADGSSDQPPSGSEEGIEVWEGMTVKELAQVIDIPSSEILKKLFLYGVMSSINKALDKATIAIVTEEFNIATRLREETDDMQVVAIKKKILDPDEVLETRPPVVTIMGHVNHGKTTLLDMLRKSRVAEGESGGITQHIGAYMVEHHGSPICFLDTPGHAAFTNMRAMGANVTDIVILVVAANDGVQPQTLESIQHAKEAEVPIIIAINKMDAEGANIDKVKSDLAENDLTPEDWGGDYLCVPISALKGEGIEQLLDAINLQAELLELKANPAGKSFGIVLESCKTDNMGPIVTVLVKSGTFKIGDPLASGHVSGKIRRMENDLGQMVKEARPSRPVRIFGFADVPDTSGMVRVFNSDKDARESAGLQADKRRNKSLFRKDIVTIDNLYSSIQAESKKDFKIILKTDVVGSLTALNHMFSSIPSGKIVLKILQSGTGAITESDVNLAHAYGAVIFAFRTKVGSSIQSLARDQHVTIKQYDVIYHAYDDVTKAMEGLLDFEYIENEIGTTEVKQLFKIGKLGMIAGCLVTSGKVTREAHCHVRRQGELLPNECKPVFVETL